VFAWLLPRRLMVIWAIAGSAAVALLDLRVIAPLLGGTLQLRLRR
jgi:hypothetical protein